MKAEKDKVVVITYDLTEGNADGEMIQLVDSNEPFEFLFGHHNVLPQFEEELGGKEVGYKFSFGIKADDAYGEREAGAVVELEKAVFNIEGEAMQEDLLQAGNVLPMVGPEGMPMDGVILEVKDTTVVMDFNHPLAGIDLHFEGEIIDIREATSEEISNEGIF
ncbi:FKBP-type peptidyl-prolyl cis-trans isomerase [Limibacter armeniacum]|uniref:FKBP-type peptidyl-prolyl cis-trans isomerase n=1 Tax=Limibacter armeniacum TaxID=466084 RepID=UPI002FE58F46